MFTRRLASSGTPCYQASTLPLPKTKNKDGGHAVAKSQRKSLNAEIIYSTPSRGFSEEFTQLLHVSPSKSQQNFDGSYINVQLENHPEEPSNRTEQSDSCPEQPINQTEGRFFYNPWQEHSRLATKIPEDEVFVVTECNELECELSNIEPSNLEESNSFSVTTSRHSSISREPAQGIVDSNMTSAQSHPSSLNLLPDVDVNPSSRSSSCSSDYTFPKRSRNSTLPVSSNHANGSEIIISGIGSTEAKSLDNCVRSESKVSLSKSPSDSDAASHTSSHRTLSTECCNQRKRSSSSRTSSNCSRSSSPTLVCCQQPPGNRKQSLQIMVAENSSDFVELSLLETSGDSKLDSTNSTSRDSQLDSSVDTSLDSKENDSRVANHSQNGGVKLTTPRVVFTERTRATRPSKLDLSQAQDTPPPAKWWTAAK